jgi:hypothetical protein
VLHVVLQQAFHRGHHFGGGHIPDGLPDVAGSRQPAAHADGEALFAAVDSRSLRMPRRPMSAIQCWAHEFGQPFMWMRNWPTCSHSALVGSQLLVELAVGVGRVGHGQVALGGAHAGHHVGQALVAFRGVARILQFLKQRGHLGVGHKADLQILARGQHDGAVAVGASPVRNLPHLFRAHLRAHDHHAHGIGAGLTLRITSWPSV